MSTAPAETPSCDHHVCPWWMGYLLASPIRKLVENPTRILEPLVGPGITALDVGCAMGFFSLPLARMVGREGRVICVDVQQRMLTTLTRRARRRGLDRVIETRLATQESLGIDDLEGQVDLALAFHVVHEATYAERFLHQCRTVLRPGGRLLVAEPAAHVSRAEFDATRRIALGLEFEAREAPALRRSHTLLLAKPGAP